MTEEERVELVNDYLHAFPEGQAPTAKSLLAEWAERFGKDGMLMHRESPGCDRCGGTGFRGRAGIHELMLVGRDIKHLIQTGARAEQIHVVAMREGMRTLRQDGIEKVLLGVTSIAEVRASSNA